MKNIKILWKVEYGKWQAGGRPLGAVLRTDYFDVKIYGPSLLTSKEEQAEVEIAYSYREETKDKKCFQKIKVFSNFDFLNSTFYRFDFLHPNLIASSSEQNHISPLFLEIFVLL